MSSILEQITQETTRGIVGTHNNMIYQKCAVNNSGKYVCNIRNSDTGVIIKSLKANKPISTLKIKETIDKIVKRG